MKRLLATLVFSPIVYACGDSSESVPRAVVDGGAPDVTSDTTTDAGPDSAGDAMADGDAGETSAPYPAFRPPVPQIQLQDGGKVVASPKIRLVYFTGETLDAQVNAAIAQWLASPVWAAQTREYGVGAASSSGATLAETPPSMLDDADIQAWLATKLGGGDGGVDAGADPAFGPTDAMTLASTVFVLFYPASTTITAFGGTSCQSFPSYHSDTVVTGKAVSYAVVPRCSTASSSILNAAMSTSVAFATNPRPFGAPAYYYFDSAHAVWNDFTLREVSSACPYPTPAMISAGTYLRTWSNAAIAAYHAPCIPDDGTPFFASVPIMTDTVTLDGAPTKGVQIPVGQSKTIDLELLSDAPTNGPWNVAVTGTGATYSLDRASGTNGDTIHLTITPTVAGPHVFTVASTLGATTRRWAGLVGQ